MSSLRYIRCPSLLPLVLVFLAYAPGALHAAASVAPREFAPGIISTGHEFTLAFTPDGHEACFSRYTQGKPLHILCSRLVGGVWQQPRPVSFSSDEWSDLDPFIMADGKRMFFISTKPHGADTTRSGKKNMDIWVAERDGESWGMPRAVENVSSDAKEGSPAVTSDGTLYFFSDRSRSPDNNALYESRLVNGHYGPPVLLPPPVNTAASDTSPFVTSDGALLLFYSDRPGGFGKGDLYVALRKQGVWGAPINLGPAVNTADIEYNPELSPDGQQLFFGRNGRIYTLPVDAVAPLRKLSPGKHSGA